MQMQNELAGIATNFKVTTRREFILTDLASNFNYRFVNIDSLNPHSLKIIQGTTPSASNQIVISPQFAKLQGYNIGDKIKIGDFNLIITGIGGDNWTVLPSTNQLNPIPNYANEPIIFLKNWIFFDNFLQYKQIVQDISSVYLNHQGTKDTLEKDLTNYKALLSASFLLKKPLKLNINIKMEKYNPSDFINRGFTSFGLIFNAYKIIISVTIIFIAIISFLIFSLIIKKAVERNYQQIGTLSALG